jgi:prepilin-type N-terminal cleavage/methylation domain-containing protein
MQPKSTVRNQDGFSLMEMMVAITVMLIVTGAIFAMVRDSLKVATTTYELVDAQENLRIAQEYINRDLMNAGDGLKSLSTLRLPQPFVGSYLTLNPITETGMPAGVINFGILTSDNNVPANTTVLATSPALTVRSSPVLTDRQTILELDRDPADTHLPITLIPGKINAAGTTVTVPTLAILNKFTLGEIYFFSSTLGGTFGAVTAKDTAALTLSFTSGDPNDPYGLNATAAGNIAAISSAGTISTTLQRMKIIHYYINSNGLLMRRVFGVKGAGMSESIIAEHVVSVQFNYGLSLTDGSGNVLQPTPTLSTPDERINVRQVEVIVTTETPHALQDGVRQQLSTTTITSVRNMQFRRALQPS